MIEIKDKHIVQSKEWGEFKLSTGVKPIRVGDIQITKHKIPLLPYYVGYAPRVNFNLQKFSWNELKTVAKNERCICIRFDVPNVLNDSSLSTKKVVEELNSKCKKAPRSTFAKFNVLLDLSISEEELITNINQKSRYNSRLAAKKGVKIINDNSQESFDIFYDLLKKTAERQKFLIHSRSYYENVFNYFKKYDMANILIAKYEKDYLSAWMLLNYKGVIYYPYGGSSNDQRNLMPSNLLAWESIKFGKKLGCTLFDMWGATNDEKSPWWGFTKFKLGYGGTLVEYIDSYDFVINKFVYRIFNGSYFLFWKLVDIVKKRNK